MIVIDNLPFSFVEGEGFKNLMHVHSPHYQVPSRKTVKAHIDKLYDEEFQKFKTFIGDVPHLTVTTDIWTDTQMRSMLGVTVHGQSKKMYSGVLGVFELTSSHTSEYISEQLEKILREHGISEDKIGAVVTDNGANIVKAVVDSFGKGKHVPCFAHTLNLVCENSLDVKETPATNNLIAKCRDM